MKRSWNIIWIVFSSLPYPSELHGQAGNSPYPGIEHAEIRFQDFYPSELQSTKINKTSFLKKVYRLATGDDRASSYSLQKPVALTASDSNEVWVADQGNQFLIGLKNNSWVLPKDFTRQQAHFPSIIGLCPLPGRGLLFTDSRLNAVFLLSRDNKTIIKLSGQTELHQPTGVAYLSKKGEIWITETADHCITILDSLGKKKRSFGSRGNLPGAFNYPTSIWIDTLGRAYVVDALNFRVQVFDEDGHYIWSFGSSGNATGYFARPKGIALDSHGNIYVVDALFNAVQIFDQQGRFLLSFGRQGRGPGEFWMPSGIYIDPNDAIYVADTYNARVQRFALFNIIERKGSRP